MQKRYSFDEIARDRNAKELSLSERKEILEELNLFLNSSKIVTFYFKEVEGYDNVISLLSKINLKSQDAFIFATYIEAKADMFLSKDSNLIKNVHNSYKGVFHAKNDLKKIKDELQIS